MNIEHCVSSLRSAQCALRGAHCAALIASFALRVLHCGFCTAGFALRVFHCAFCITRCGFHASQCTNYDGRCAMVAFCQITTLAELGSGSDETSRSSKGRSSHPVMSGRLRVCSRTRHIGAWRIDLASEARAQRDLASLRSVLSAGAGAGAEAGAGAGAGAGARLTRTSRAMSPRPSAGGRRPIGSRPECQSAQRRRRGHRREQRILGR